MSKEQIFKRYVEYVISELHSDCGENNYGTLYWNHFPFIMINRLEYFIIHREFNQHLDSMFGTSSMGLIAIHWKKQDQIIREVYYG